MMDFKNLNINNFIKFDFLIYDKDINNNYSLGINVFI